MLYRCITLVAVVVFVACAATPSSHSADSTHNFASAQQSSKRDINQPPSIPDLVKGKEEPPTPDQAKEQLAQLGHNWLYGYGMGRTVLNIGTIVIFPPYAIYVLGNAGLQLAGYKPLYVTDALPETPRQGVLGVYNEVTSVPGRVSAGIGREKFEEETKAK